MFLIMSQTDNRLLWICNHRFRCPVLDGVMPIITHLGSAGGTIIMVLVMMFTGFLLKNNSFLEAGVAAGLALLSSTLLVQLIKRKVKRPRPRLVVADLDVFDVPICPYSFPSGHSCAAMSVAVAAFFPLPLLGSLLFTLAAIISFSRVYLGVHFLSDVLAGAFIGVTFGLIAVYCII